MKQDLKAKFKLWFSTADAEGVFGDGKWRLLMAIERTGSLKKAAESMGISYRKAWGDLKKAEAGLDVKFIEKNRGGKDGGRTVLTDEGKRWIQSYTRLRNMMEKEAEKSFTRFKKAVARKEGLTG